MNGPSYKDYYAILGVRKGADAKEIKAAFKAAGVDVRKPVVTTCGSGVTASVLALALARLGYDRTAVYDGSWTEWASLPDTPVVTGP